MQDKTLLSLGAMLCITILEALALYFGYDSAMLALVFAVIAGLAGYQVKNVMMQEQGRKKK